MKKLLLISLLTTSILTTHQPLSCMDSEEYSSQEYSGEDQPSNKRVKVELSDDEQAKIDGNLIEAIVTHNNSKVINCLNQGASLEIDLSNDMVTLEFLEKNFPHVLNHHWNGDDYSFCPLAIAAYCGFLDIIKDIIAYSNDNDPIEEWMYDEALDAAFRNNQSDIMEFLINECGADVDYRFCQNQPLFWFIDDKTSTKSLSVLLKHGYDIDSADYDNDGSTGLCKAAEHGNTAAVKLLLESEASLYHNHQPDFNNPLEIALINNHPDTALCILKHFMPSHDLYPADAYKTDAYKKLKVLLVGFYKKDESNPSNLTKLPKDLLYTIISYTPELIFNKKLLVQIISHNRCNKPLVSNCNDDFQDVQPLLESMARLKLDEQGKTVLKQFKSSSIFANHKSGIDSEEYDTSKITDLEKKNLLDALLNPNTPDNDQCYQTLFAMNLWDDLQKKNAPAASKDAKPSNENTSSPIDQTHNSGKQEE